MNRNGQINSDDHYIYYFGQESLRIKGIAFAVNKSPKCSTWVQLGKRQNDLGSFPRQTTQHHSMPQSLMLKKLKFNSFLRIYKTF